MEDLYPAGVEASSAGQVPRLSLECELWKFESG